MTDNDDLEAWRNTDPLDWGLGDEQLELLADITRRLVLGEPVSRDERRFARDYIVPILAAAGVARFEQFMAEGGEP